MTDKHYFADVELPFHVWVREGGRWMLREAPGADRESRSHERPRLPPRSPREHGSSRPTR